MPLLTRDNAILSAEKAMERVRETLNSIAEFISNYNRTYTVDPIKKRGYVVKISS